LFIAPQQFSQGRENTCVHCKMWTATGIDMTKKHHSQTHVMFYFSSFSWKGWVISAVSSGGLSFRALYTMDEGLVPQHWMPLKCLMCVYPRHVVIKQRLLSAPILSTPRLNYFQSSQLSYL
jgi:hypothetical protein